MAMFTHILSRLKSIILRSIYGEAVTKLPATQAELLLLTEEKSRLRHIPRYQPGTVKTILGQLSFSDACTLLEGEREIFHDRVYLFSPPNNPIIIIDCGANIGLASIWFAIEYNNASIFAYEADPYLAALLGQNIRSLGLSDRVSTYNYAIWSDSNGVFFDHEGGFSGQVSGHGHELVKKSSLVPSITLNQILLDFDHVDLLKIDIEGAEHLALTDEVDLSMVKRVFLEYHSHQSDPQKLDHFLALFSAKGFRYHIKEAYPSAHPFEEINTLLGMDLQLNIYAYR